MRILPSKTLLSSQQKLKSMLNNLKHPSQVKEKPECMSLIYFGCPGYQVLEQKSRAVKNLDQRLNVYIESLKMTAAFNNLASLSAPQVGIDFCLFVMLKSFKGINKFILDKPLFPNQYRAIINPRILEIAEMKEFGWETCGSFLNVKSRISRPISLKVDFYNDNLDIETEALEGFSARIFQHEMDHLEGKTIMYLEKNQCDIIMEERKLENLDEITENDKRYFETMMKIGEMMEKENNNGGNQRNNESNNEKNYERNFERNNQYENNGINIKPRNKHISEKKNQKNK